MNHLKRRLTTLVAYRKERVGAAGMRCLLERLEDRTMLSASHGSIPHGQGVNNSNPHGGHGAPIDHSPALVSQPNKSGRNDSQMIRESRTLGSIHREFQAEPSMQPAF